MREQKILVLAGRRNQPPETHNRVQKGGVGKMEKQVMTF